MKTYLKELRKKAGWKNADDFAESIGMNPKTYRNYEQGVRKMGLDVASEICNALECSINDLVEPASVYYAYVDLSKEDDARSDERELLSLYRRMVDEDKSTFMDMARTLALAGDIKKEDARGAASRDAVDVTG